MSESDAGGVERSDVRPSQIQYQLLTASLAIGNAYDSAEDAPEGVNEALRHIQTAQNLLSDPDEPLGECRPSQPVEFESPMQVRSDMSPKDWEDVAESTFVDVAETNIVGDPGFVFEHDELGLHGFIWRTESKTLEPTAFEAVDGGECGESESSGGDGA